MQVIRDDLWLCSNCLIVAVNGDYSGIEDEKLIAKINKGLEKLGPHLVPDFDSETEEGINEFSAARCNCCGTFLAGSRHRFAILGD